MLLKLFKYDVRSIARYWWISIGLTIGASLFIAVGGRALAESIAFLTKYESAIEELFPNLAIYELASFIMVYVMIIAMFCIYGGMILISISALITEVMVGVRFFKNLFTDEGYLTFTLPVSKKQILFSKFISGTLFILSHMVVTVASIPIWALVIPPSLGEGLINPIVFTAMFSAFWDAIGMWTVPWTLVYVSEAAFFLISSAVYSLSIMYFSVTLGAVVVKKGKVFASLGSYYLINNTVAGFVSVITSFSANGLVFTSISSLIERAGVHGTLATVAIMMLIYVAVMLTFAVVFYCGTRHLLERRLNLS